MQWLVTNGFWVLIGFAFIAMHLFGHGGHGGHSRGGDSGRQRPMAGSPDGRPARNAGWHHH